MAREVQVMAWCDVDMAEDRRVPMAASHEVVLDGKAYTLDLCEDHEAALYKPFAGLVAHGSAPAAKAAQNRAQRALAAPRPVTSTGLKQGRPLGDQAKALPLGARCIVADCGRAFDGRTQGALLQHMRAAHNFTVEALGRICPVCGEVKDPGNGMATHVARQHPDAAPESFNGLLAAWWWASVHHDPEGAIAASGFLPFTPSLAPGGTRVQVHP